MALDVPTRTSARLALKRKSRDTPLETNTTQPRTLGRRRATSKRRLQTPSAGSPRDEPGSNSSPLRKHTRNSTKVRSKNKTSVESATARTRRGRKPNRSIQGRAKLESAVTKRLRVSDVVLDPSSRRRSSSGTKRGTIGVGERKNASPRSGLVKDDVKVDHKDGEEEKEEVAESLSSDVWEPESDSGEEFDPRSELRSWVRGGRRAVVQFSLPCSDEDELLLCRDVELAKMRDFMEQGIRNVALESRWMYVSGMPGTGKTATAHCAITQLRMKSREGKLPPFEVLEINGMTIGHPGNAYIMLCERLCGKLGLSRRRAAETLGAFFSRTGPSQGRMKQTCVVVLDELDAFCEKNTKVLYDFLEWPNRPASRLIVVGIANTMDLPERLPPRLASRLGLNRIVYKAYDSRQLQSILESKMRGTPSCQFQAGAIELCAKKVSVISGDVRRAVEICRRASEIACSTHVGRGPALVDMKTVTQAVSDLNSASQCAAIRALSFLEKVTLIAVALRSLRGAGSCILGEALDSARVVARQMDIPPEETPCLEELNICCLALCRGGWIEVDHRPVLHLSKLSLSVEVEDIRFALGGTKWMNPLRSG